MLALVPGTLVQMGLRGGQAHAYLLDLAAGDYAGLIVDQRGIDVAVSLQGPDGRRLAAIDSTNGSQGPEPLPVVAVVAGMHRLEIRSPDVRAAPGRYAVRLDVLRPAAARDRTRVAAERTFAQGEELRLRDDPPSLAAAVEREEKALALFRQIGQRDREAEALFSLGRTHASLGNNREAADHYRQALALFRELGEEARAGVALNNLGHMYRSLGNPQAAVECYREALRLHRRFNNRFEQAITLNNIGRASLDLGETERALTAFEEALAVWRKLGDRGNEGLTLSNSGNTYIILGQPEKAIDHLVLALRLLESADRVRERAIALALLGQARALAGRSRAEVLEAYERALHLQRQIGDRLEQAITMHNLACFHNQLGERRNARRAFHAALVTFRELGDTNSEATALNNLGMTDLDLERTDAAVLSFSRALRLSTASGDLETQAQALFGLASARRRQGELTAALQAVEPALARIESLRGKPASPELRSTFLASKQDFFELYVSLLMELHRREPGSGYDARALAVSEEARARSLLDLLTEARADLRRDVDPALLAQEAELTRRIEMADRRRQSLVVTGAAVARLEAAETDLRGLLARFDRLQSRIRLASPGYAALVQPRPLSLEQIQKRVVDRDTLLLEYALGRERSFLWAVTPGGIESFELPPRAAIEEAARRSSFLLAASDQRLARAQADAALAELSQILLQPVAHLLTPGRRLLVVPDGALHYIPFGALPVAGGQPIVLQHEVVSLPSASTLTLLAREPGRRDVPGVLAVLADPVFDIADPRVPGMMQSPSAGPAVGSSLPLDRLLYSHAEAAAILSLAPPRQTLSALGFEASRETVLSGALRGYRIVHFATHGILDAEHPELSGIALSRVDRQGRPRNGFLYAHEIYRLDLPADLVVLSACQTALGREIRGDGLVGLTRGFLYAGARQVLVSLWPVDDRATAELMRRFYREMLGAGRPPAAALRAAQVSMWQEDAWRSPYYWAGFILQGDWRAGGHKPFRQAGIFPSIENPKDRHRRMR